MKCSAGDEKCMCEVRHKSVRTNVVVKLIRIRTICPQIAYGSRKYMRVTVNKNCSNLKFDMSIGTTKYKDWLAIPKGFKVKKCCYI